jgi:hypothetical protein
VGDNAGAPVAGASVADDDAGADVADDDAGAPACKPDDAGAGDNGISIEFRESVLTLSTMSSYADV